MRTTLAILAAINLALVFVLALLVVVAARDLLEPAVPPNNSPCASAASAGDIHADPEGERS